MTKDLRLVEREIQIDAEIIERDIERVPLTLENFIAKEPPILVGMFFLACINGTIGLFWALFFREAGRGRVWQRNRRAAKGGGQGDLQVLRQHPRKLRARAVMTVTPPMNPPCL